MQMKTLAVLLTVHNRRDKTITCLRNLYAQSTPSNMLLDVFLVDDGSTDGTTEAIRERYPMTHIIPGDGNLFWNRGMHRAWEVAAKEHDYDYYLWLNDDTVLFPFAINALLSICMSNNDKVIAVGATQNIAGDKITYGGRVGTHIAPCDGSAHEVEKFNGNIVLIPKYVYNKLGNLDSYYTHSKGDFDYGLRAGKLKIKMYQCGDVLGVCEEHEYIDAWCNPDIPFRKRWQLMLRPNGMPPNETFHYEKQISIWMAAFHFMTVLLRCMFPKLWVKKCSLN